MKTYQILSPKQSYKITQKRFKNIFPFCDTSQSNVAIWHALSPYGAFQNGYLFHFYATLQFLFALSQITKCQKVDGVAQYSDPGVNQNTLVTRKVNWYRANETTTPVC